MDSGDNVTPIVRAPRRPTEATEHPPETPPAKPRITFSLGGPGGLNTICTFDADDKTDEICMRLDHIVAIANLVQTVAGQQLDGSDSNVEDLLNGTLNQAMYCIRQFADQVKAIECAEVLHG